MPDTALQTFADRLSSDPTYLAFVVRHYCGIERVNKVDVAQLLGINDRMLLRLELCKTPDPEADDFAERVCAIADFTLSDDAALADIIRRSFTVGHLQTARPAISLPAAARDRSDQGASTDGPEGGDS
jgi:hypothetical protein